MKVAIQPRIVHDFRLTDLRDLAPRQYCKPGCSRKITGEVTAQLQIFRARYRIATDKGFDRLDGVRRGPDNEYCSEAFLQSQARR